MEEQLAVKSVMAGVAGWYLAKQYGLTRSAWRIGSGIAATNVLIYLVVNRVNRDSWMKPKDSLFSQNKKVKIMIRNYAFIVMCIKGLFILAGGESKFRSRLGAAFQRGALPGLRELARGCLFTPIAERIIFQGFIQENIQEVQEWLENPNTSQKKLRQQKKREMLQPFVAGGAILLAGGGIGTAIIQGLNNYVLFTPMKEEQGIHAVMMFDVLITTAFSMINLYMFG